MLVPLPVRLCSGLGGTADFVAELSASLASLGPVAWVRLNEQEVRFTIIPEQGTQVWA